MGIFFLKKPNSFHEFLWENGVPFLWVVFSSLPTGGPEFIHCFNYNSLQINSRIWVNLSTDYWQDSISLSKCRSQNSRNSSHLLYVSTYFMRFFSIHLNYFERYCGFYFVNIIILLFNQNPKLSNHFLTLIKWLPCTSILPTFSFTVALEHTFLNSLTN